MSQIVRSLTFEKPSGGIPTGNLYDITTAIPSGTLVLSSARVDLVLASPTDYASIPKSISLEIGTVIGSSFVVDNDVNSNYFKVTLSMENRTTIGGVTYLTSLTYPNTSFRMNGDLHRQCVFKVRDSSGVEIPAASIPYFCFHFSAISTS